MVKPSRNKARKLRARRRKELERAELEKGEVEGGGDHPPVAPLVVEVEGQGVEESKETEPLPMASKLEEDDVPGLWDDSDSEEDERPSRWGKAGGVHPNPELDDCPDLLPSWEEIDEANRLIAEQIRSRPAEAQKPEPVSAAAAPMVPLADGADASAVL